MSSLPIASGGYDPDMAFPLKVAFDIGFIRDTPPRVDHRFKDGDTIRLGSTSLTAHLTPGSSHGCTSWSFPVTDGDRVLNVQSLGSWLEFALPDRLYALDSRIEVFPVEVWDDYDRVWHGIDGWQDVLAKWAPAAIVTGPDDGDLVQRLVANGWQNAYHDVDGTVLVRT